MDWQRSWRLLDADVTGHETRHVADFYPEILLRSEAAVVVWQWRQRQCYRRSNRYAKFGRDMLEFTSSYHALRFNERCRRWTQSKLGPIRGMLIGRGDCPRRFRNRAA